MPDLATALLRHGYDALPRLRARATDPDAYPVRLMGRHAVVVRGEEGARLFYDTSRFMRHGAAPAPLADVLFGHGAVHGLDGEEHRVRKAMFLDLLTADEVAALRERIAIALEVAVGSWEEQGPVRLFEELVGVYGAAALAWAGTGCAGERAERVSRDLAAIVDGFGFRARAYARAWRARRRCNAWAAHLVRDVRRGDLHVRPGSALEVVALGAGAELPEDVAAVELLNVLRPTVAAAWLGTFAAVLLADHPEQGERVLADPAALQAFAHEVRRRAPFVPALAARAITQVEHGGQCLRPGQRLVLDVPGTDHHPALWPEPDAFRPERFAGSDPREGATAFRFLPQGGGDARTGHRCPGEDVTTALLTATVERMARTPYGLADARTDRTRIPALPRHGLVVTIRPKG